MHYDQLFTHFYERSNALQWYWTLYVIIIGGVLAFASLRQGWSRTDIITTALVSILYCCFAYKNLGAIHDVLNQRQDTLEAMAKLAISPEAPSPDQRAILERSMINPPYEGIRNFHVTCDILAVAALWAMHRRRRFAARTVTK